MSRESTWTRNTSLEIFLEAVVFVSVSGGSGGGWRAGEGKEKRAMTATMASKGATVAG